MRTIKDTVILIGYNEAGKCVYSDSLETSDYYDGEHIWDDGKKVKKLKLRKVKGYLFDKEGELSQEFESIFNLETGIYESGFARFADGTESRD
jgi:hypothetical protein